ncbi:hypothetical protein BDEG_27074 [Batrachochytrium dendrobatidis JEL423]|uniref:AB hydrolase-1 domain-containing protein n=1 Tax=Batrachochytrium dendrobatidis (strain JEL423) TaxID=403673 RepID=A0A177WV12_BATDL|nr:hypothetical protein BDEG_27074 [Batrachochytrium dendrobatidis JEL423]
MYPSSFPQGSRDHVSRPDEFQMSNYESVSIKTKDGVMITGYLIKPTASNHSSISADALPSHTLLYLHANAGNMGMWLTFRWDIEGVINSNNFAFRYGHSQGTPNETGMKIDAQAALDYIKSHDKLKDTKVLVYGQSIGGAVAINLVSENKDRISALIIENTFLSLAKKIDSTRHQTFTSICIPMSPNMGL